MMKNHHQKTEVPDPQEFENKRRGGGGQRDYNYLSQRKPRRRRKDFPKIDLIAKFPAKFLILMHLSTNSIHVKKAYE